MRSSFAASLFLLGLGLTALADDKAENPFKTAKVGDFLIYKTTLKGQPTVTTTKQTVVAATDKEVTIEIQTSIDKNELPKTTTKIDLTKNYDPADLAKAAKITVEKIATGSEKVKVGDKEYDCTWTKTKTLTKVMDKEFAVEAKTWVSKSIPLNGVVKVETNSDFISTTMELVEFGNKK